MPYSNRPLLDKVVEETQKRETCQSKVVTVTSTSEFLKIARKLPTPMTVSPRKKTYDDKQAENIFDEIRFYLQVYQNQKKKNQPKTQPLKQRLTALIDLLSENMEAFERFILESLKLSDQKSMTAALYILNSKLMASSRLKDLEPFNSLLSDIPN